jgi:hypothetical protein
MKVTKKNIQAAIKKRYDVDVELFKTDGFYYWSGKATCFFNECCTYIKYLDDLTFDRWLEDFDLKAKDGLYWSDFDSLKEAVQKTNWSL